MSSLRTFLSGIIDYAGLFPPAKVSMEAAVANYAEYRSGDDRDLLGRFIVPAGRIEEFSNAARHVLPRGADANPWQISAIVTGDSQTARKSLLEFNCSHWRGSDLGHATVDSVEIRVGDNAGIAAAKTIFPDSLKIFCEITSGPGVDSLVDAIAETGVLAKIRTGGTTPEVFPSSTDVIRFISLCHQRRVRFKATAGLHHPLRASYPLTYESGSPRGPMFGYLNVFLAAAFIHSGFSDDIALGVLEASDAARIRFDDDRAEWNGHRIAADGLASARSDLALSFGSCSFTEPVDEARQLGFL
ncbi:MAG: hypothetical protein ABIR58_01705 [Gemmatimonadaceae bacterium]